MDEMQRLRKQLRKAKRAARVRTLPDLPIDPAAYQNIARMFELVDPAVFDILTSTGQCLRSPAPGMIGVRPQERSRYPFQMGPGASTLGSVRFP